MADNNILARLSGFIDYESPELAEFLYGMWGDQANAITYHELRDAIMDGSLSLDYLRQWQQDYSRFITEAYAPKVDRAVAQAAADLRREYGVDFHDPMFSKVDSFIQTNGGQLIRQVSVEQYQAVNALVRQAALTNTLTVDQAARAIRPCVGLTRRQAQTTKRFYDNLIEEGYSHKRAHERQLVYAAKIHRRRAALIAQTEMARAYSYGWHATIQQNVEDGILPPGTRKVWLTADYEKVCPECGKMNGESVLWNEPFSNGSLYPPAHPNCRCHHKIDFVDLLPQAQIHVEEPPVQRAQAQVEVGGEDTVADDYTVMTDPTRTGIINPSQGLLSGADDGIIQTEGTIGWMNRRTGNHGVFSELPERMSKKHIREIANEYDIDLNGITIGIEKDPDLLRPEFPFAGRADPTKIGRIDFLPKAFRSKEELIRTLYHERMHVQQFRQFGAEYVQINRAYFEEITSNAENQFIKLLKEAGKL